MELARKQDSWKGFNQIAKTYDLLNRLTSLGIDRNWRKRLTSYIPQSPQVEVLDLATGTADVAIEIIHSAPQVKQVIGVDPAFEMINQGKKKINALEMSDKIQLQVGNALNLPFADASFDVVTMAFGIRNVPDVPQALREIYRVLRPGGRVIILELSMPRISIIRGIYSFYFRYVLPTIGGLISGNRQAYVYLNQSVEAFPSGQDFLKLMSPVGFKKEQAIPLTLGVASLYLGAKMGE